MFIGHFAVALGAKKSGPSISLGMLFLACQFADLLWPNLVLMGIEKLAIEPGATAFTPLNFVSYPYSHSLVALLIWGTVLGLGYGFVSGWSRRNAVIIAVTVLSHWILDWVTHRPDMPLTFGDGRRVGLGLWNSVPGTLIFELSLFASGLYLYTRATSARDGIGRYGFWGLIFFLLLIYVLNLFSSAPPGVAAVAWTAQAMWILVLWAFWVDRHRAAKLSAET